MCIRDRFLVASTDSEDVSFVVREATHPVVVRLAFIFAAAGTVGCAVRAVPLTAAIAGHVVVLAGVFLIAGETPAAGKSFIHVRGGELGGGGKSDGGTSDGVITGS